MQPPSRLISHQISIQGCQGVSPNIKINSPFLFGLQEPPAYKGKIVGFGSFQKLIYSNKNGDPRAAIYASRSLHIWPMIEFCDRDTAVGLWKTGNNNINEIIVVSVYMDIIYQVSGLRLSSG